MKKRKSIIYRLHWPWSLFCSPTWLLPLLIIWLFSFSEAHAIDISAIYTSACERQNGVIINADDSKLQLLTLAGAIKEISRFNIIYIASYPVGHLPIKKAENISGSQLVSIKSIYNNQIVDLVKGWMIDQSEEQISFLTLNGTEVVIDIKEIWDLRFETITGDIEFPSVQANQYRFVHPYPFMHCNQDTETVDTHFLIYPQHLLEDPILIKNELDRLAEGYDRLRNYENDQAFYAVPQIYRNESILGVWGNIGSRYGASKNRNNNFIPEIRSESSDGPFSFQYVLVTGNSLMPYGLHEEPQMHLYYALKADYVHFAIMVDFNRFVMGETKYQWHKDDLSENDDRENDTLNVSGGFDYGAFAFDLSVWNRIQYGIRFGDYFHEDDMSLNKAGIFFQNRLIKAELYYGFGMDEKPEQLPIPDDADSPMAARIEAENALRALVQPFYTEFKFIRLNLELKWLQSVRPVYSLIYRSIDLVRDPNQAGEGAFMYQGRSFTNALYLDYVLDDEIRLSGYLSLEVHQNDFGLTNLDDSASQTYPKMGMNMALVF